MKKILYMVFLSALACACTKSIEIVDPYSSGVCVGEILLETVSGRLTIGVETKGTWRVESDQPWLKTDVKGYDGDGAFTVSYESNLSDVLYVKKERTAKVTIRLEETMKTDTLVFVQRGMFPVEAKRKVLVDPALKIECNPVDPQECVVICCCSDGEDGKIQEWLQEQQYDILVLDGKPEGTATGLDLHVEGITSVPDECLPDSVRCASCDMEYDSFRKQIREGYNKSPDAGDYWIYAGQMYHNLSVMQTDYQLTPGWYPKDIAHRRFRSDIFAWENNLYDCLWMYSQDYVQTWTNNKGESFCADYVYVSAAVLALISSVEVLEVEGLFHKPVKLTLKY